MKKIMTIALAIFSPIVSAGYFTGPVETIVVDKNPQYNNGVSVVHILTTAEHIDKPADCKPGFFVLSLADEYGQNLLAKILDAKASGRKVKVMGKGVCEDTWPDAETVKSIDFK